MKGSGYISFAFGNVYLKVILSSIPSSLIKAGLPSIKRGSIYIKEVGSNTGSTSKPALNTTFLAVSRVPYTLKAVKGMKSIR
jgi:hypothetical protein